MSRRVTVEMSRLGREDLAPLSGHSLFPVTYSLLSAEAVRAEVARVYAIGAPVACQLLKCGLNDTYLVRTRDDRYIVRVYRAQWRTPSHIAYELELLTHLAARGVSVSVPLAARDGSLAHSLLASEGTRQLALFTYAQGTPLAWDDKDHAHLAGRALAAMHAASEDFGSGYARFQLDLGYLIDAPLAMVRPFLAHRPEDWRYLERLADALRARAEAAIQAGLEWGVCHGDLSTRNIYITENGTWTILDFDFCGPGWRVYDLAVAQWFTLDRHERGLWEAFLTGYTETRPLAAADLAAVPLFYGISRLRSLGLRAATVDDMGSLRMNDKNLDQRLTVLREWVTEHLDGQGAFTEVTSLESRRKDKITGDMPVADGTRQGASTAVTPAKTAQSREAQHFHEPSRPDQPDTIPTPGSALFPVSHSVLAAEAVLAEVVQAYPIDTPATCQLLMPGMNDTYLITTRGSRSIIRIYRAQWRTPSEIGYELELLRHLAARGVSVSVPIAARDESLIRPLLAPEGTRYLVLFTYARGTPLSWTEEEHCYRAGRLLAAIHAAAEDFGSGYVRFQLDLGYLIDAPLAAVRPFMVHRPEDWRYLEGFTSRLRTRAEAAVGAGLDWGVCHGDFSSTGNFHIAEDQTLTVFDFDLCGPGWRAYDLAPIHRAARGYKNSAIWDTFLKGYIETRPLAAADLAAVPLFHTVNRLWSLGMRAGNVAKWGALFMGDWYLDSQLTFFRNWEAEHGER